MAAKIKEVEKRKLIEEADGDIEKNISCLRELVEKEKEVQAMAKKSEELQARLAQPKKGEWLFNRLLRLIIQLIKYKG